MDRFHVGSPPYQRTCYLREGAHVLRNEVVDCYHGVAQVKESTIEAF
jgi:hypothetical protein